MPFFIGTIPELGKSYRLFEKVVLVGSIINNQYINAGCFTASVLLKEVSSQKTQIFFLTCARVVKYLNSAFSILGGTKYSGGQFGKEFIYNVTVTYIIVTF
jgi:hypothetical protein